MTSETTAEPIRLDQPLDLADESGLVDIRGRIIRDGVVEAEAEGRVERGDIGLPPLVIGRFEMEPADTRADVYYFETTMERLMRNIETIKA